MSNLLFEPLQVGSCRLAHRVVMAPLTRYRADSEHVHHDIAREYYEQRAQREGTLLITEGSFIAPQAGGYDNVPGIYNKDQINGWKKVVDAVHAKGSFIYLQLWALGRAADGATMEKDGYPVVSSSGKALENGATPKSLTLEEVSKFVQYYASAARNFVKEAGGDGVEIHGANGYLIDQFFSTTSNFRTDKYGGSVENRIRFGLEVVDAVSDAIGPERVGIRISPFSPFQEMKMPAEDIASTFGTFAKQLRQRQPNLAYLHVVQSRISGASDAAAVENDQAETLDFLHDVWSPRPMLVAGAFKRDTAIEEANKRENVAIVFGRYFISNPDLVDRLEKDQPLEPYNRKTFYLKGTDKTQGYTDYPNYSSASPASRL